MRTCKHVGGYGATNDLKTTLEIVAKLKVPMYSETSDGLQYTGKGWRVADAVAEGEKLRELQQQLAVRQAEMVGDGGE